MTKIRLIAIFRGVQRQYDFEVGEITVGKPREGHFPDLDLTPDEKASRRHLRIFDAEGKVWVEDRGSKNGTKLNDEEIKGTGQHLLQQGDRIEAGDTILRVESLEPVFYPEGNGETLMVAHKSISPESATPAGPPDDPLKFLQALAGVSAIDDLLNDALGQIVKLVPGAKRGAILLGEGLLLKAQHPPDSKPSTTLAQKALQEKRMLLWPCADEVIKTKPPSLKQVAYAIYAPLLWRGQALGVLCLDTGEEGGWPFTSNVAQLVEALAVPLAYFVANLRLSEALHGQEEKHKALERLVPKEALERLGRHQNRIKLGGEIREVTVLFSDLRGFTNLSKDMRSDDVADFLEAYFGELVPVIAKHGGTIDKFVGDAILAVFGSSIKGMQAEAAVDAALEMQAEIKALNKARSQAGKPVGELGIGLHCGTVMHGFIGTLERAEFTVIGDTVNRASRYCDGAGRGEVLISPDVFALVWRAYETERTAIPTKHEGELKAYRVKSKVK